MWWQWQTGPYWIMLSSHVRAHTRPENNIKLGTTWFAHIHAWSQTRVHKPVCTKVYQCYATLHHAYGLMGGPYSQEVRNLSNVADYRECLAHWDNWCSNPDLPYYSPYGRAVGITLTESFGFSIPLSLKKKRWDHHSIPPTRPGPGSNASIQQAVQWFWVPLLKRWPFVSYPPLWTDSPKQTYGYSWVSISNNDQYTEKGEGLIQHTNKTE